MNRIACGPAAIVISLGLLSGCSFAGAPVGSSGIAPAAHDAGGRIAPVPPSVIYVANFGGNNIIGFPLNVRGNVAPIIVLGGPKTGITNPRSIGVDSAANVFTLLHTSDAGGAQIGVFKVGSNGNVAPTRVIIDAITSHAAQLVTVDPVGTVYLLYHDANQHNGIDVFAPGASGVVNPTREIAGPKTLLDAKESIVSLFADNSRTVWWACNGAVGVPRVVGYAKTANGNVAPTVELPADQITKIVNPNNVGVDTAGEVFVRSLGTKPSVLVFAPGATGDVAPIRSTELPANYGVADVYEHLLVGFGKRGPGMPTVGSFNADLSGPQQPLREITGSLTKLNKPAGVGIN